LTRDAPLLICESLRVGYLRPVTQPIDLTVRPGDFWVIIGRNGTGKTTWFRTVLGLIPAISGRVHTRPGLRTSYVAQRTQFDPLFPVLARDVVAMAHERGRSCFGFRFRSRPEVAAALERVGASELAEQPFRALSEGQKQRVLLARLWVAQAELALLDEPTSAMDVVAERSALAALDDLRKTTGCTILVVTHDIALAREFASHVLLFDTACESVIAGPAGDVLSHAFFHRNYPEIGCAKF
jgi:zinc transport system ATP-binding protein